MSATYFGEPAKNVTTHEEPSVYVCPGCSVRKDFSKGELAWTERVRAVREHLVTAHGWHHLPPSTDGVCWYFPEDYPA